MINFKFIWLILQNLQHFDAGEFNSIHNQGDNFQFDIHFLPQQSRDLGVIFKEFYSTLHWSPKRKYEIKNFDLKFTHPLALRNKKKNP